MKKFKIIMLVTGLIILISTSCKQFLEGYLDKAPEQGLPEEQIFTKLTNFKLFFDAVYAGRSTRSGLWSGGMSDFNIKECFPLYWDAWDQKYSIDGVTDAADMGRYMEGHAWKSGNMSETIVNKMTYDGARNPTLASCFMDIRIANIALLNVDRIADATPAEINDLRAQAYFVRALCHMTLFKFWGRMPYITFVIGANPTEWDLPRLSNHETLTKVAADFDTAYFYFEKAGMIRRDPPFGVPGHGQYSSYQMYRPNGMVAKAWKAKALLWAASPLSNEHGVTDWQDAAVAAWDALKLAQDNGVSLIPMIDRTKNYYGADVCDESLWSYTAGLNNWNSGNWASSTNRGNFQTFFNGVLFASTGSNSGICPTQNYIDKYETIFGEPLNTQADRDAAALAGHYNEQTPFVGRDPRLAIDIMYNQSPCSGWGTPATTNRAEIWFSVSGGVTSWSELLNQGYLGITRTGYYIRKIWFNNSSRVTGQSIVADPLCRMAEVYLNYAEAANEAYGGPTGIAPGATMTALDAVNAVRTRAGMPNVLAAYTDTKDHFRTRIKNERAVELAYEGHHYYNDIKRWMDLPTVMGSTLYGMVAEKVTVSPTYPTGFKYVRQPLSADRQPVWKPQMYYLPFNNSDALKMTQFVANPVW
jgi:starch-binding outer membrane protein, SusD/RagB family